MNICPLQDITYFQKKKKKNIFKLAFDLEKGLKVTKTVLAIKIVPKIYVLNNWKSCLYILNVKEMFKGYWEFFSKYQYRALICTSI